MKGIHEVSQQKESELAHIRKEVESLHIAALDRADHLVRGTGQRIPLRRSHLRFRFARGRVGNRSRLRTGPDNEEYLQGSSPIHTSWDHGPKPCLHIAVI